MTDHQLNSIPDGTTCTCGKHWPFNPSRGLGDARRHLIYAERRAAKPTVCVAEGCQKPVFVQVRGLCAMHDSRTRNHGNLIGKRPQIPIYERFMQYVDKTPGGCWTWTGQRNYRNYGQFYDKKPDGRRTIAAHRWSYEYHCGPIPDGAVVMHSCDNPPCVAPDHLSIGTQIDNIADMLAKGRSWPQKTTTCRKGHPWTEENTRWERAGDRVVRRCLVCRRASNAARYLPTRAA